MTQIMYNVNSIFVFPFFREYFLMYQEQIFCIFIDFIIKKFYYFTHEKNCIFFVKFVPKLLNFECIFILYSDTWSKKQVSRDTIC